MQLSISNVTLHVDRFECYASFSLLVTLHLNRPRVGILPYLTYMADCKLEQRVYRKIRPKLRFSATDIHADLQKVYKENALQYGAVAKWVCRFKDGRESVEVMREPGALSQPPPKRNLML